MTMQGSVGEQTPRGSHGSNGPLEGVRDVARTPLPGGSTININISVLIYRRPWYRYIYRTDPYAVGGSLNPMDRYVYDTGT